MNRESSDGGPGDLDVEELFRQLHDLGEEMRAVRSLRPSRNEMGTVLAAWLNLFDAEVRRNTSIFAPTLNEDDRVQAIEAAAWRGAPESNAATDPERLQADGWAPEFVIPDFGGDGSRILYVARTLVEASLDHARAIALVMFHEGLTRSPVALARVVLDGLAHAFHVLDPEISAEERQVRVMAEDAASAGERYLDARRQCDTSALEEARGEIEAIRDLLGSHGHTLEWSPKGTRPPRVKGMAGTREMIEHLLGIEVGIWSLLSGFVHNREGSGWRLALGLEWPGEAPQRTELIALWVLPVALALPKLRHTLTRYCAWDLSRVEEMDEGLRNVWAAGGGMFDDDYRERLGLPRRGES